MYKSRIFAILNIIIIIPIFIITKGHNIFLYTLSFSLYTLLTILFSHIDIANYLVKYGHDKFNYTVRKVYKLTMVSCFILSIIIGALVSLSGLVLQSLLSIDKIFIVYLVMSLSIFTIPCFNITLDYLKLKKYFKLKNVLLTIYCFFNFLYIVIGGIIFFRVLKLEDYLSISLLYLGNILSFIITYLIFYFIAFKNKKNRSLKTREEQKINCKKIVKEIFSNNITISIVNVIKYFIFYFGIIFLYIILTYRYHYNYTEVTNVINNVYFYGIRIAYIIVIVFRYVYDDKFLELKNNLFNKNNDENKLFISFFNNLINNLLSIVILISVIAGDIWFLFFNNITDCPILIGFMILFFFFIIYSYIIEILFQLKNKKKLYITLFIGIIVKIVLIMPLVDAMYRMGYNLIYGDFISSIICYIVTIIISLFFINFKCKLNLTHNFEKILTIIYENIILCFILLIFTFLVSIRASSKIQALFTIIFYIAITVIYFIVNKKIKRLKNG